MCSLRHATAVLLTPGTNLELLPPSIILGARALTATELATLHGALAAARGTPGADVIGRPAAWNSEWFGIQVRMYAYLGGRIS